MGVSVLSLCRSTDARVVLPSTRVRIAAFPGLKPLLPGLCGSQAIDSAYEEIKETCKLSSLGPARKKREQAASSEFAVSNTKQQKKGWENILTACCKRNVMIA
jgi:hypothetical protein